MTQHCKRKLVRPVKRVKFWMKRIFIEIKNGIVMGFPYQLLEGLESATPEQLGEVKVTPSGYGLHWESLDVDLGVSQLVAGILGTKTGMKKLGRLGDWQNLLRRQRLPKKMGSVEADLARQRLQCCTEWVRLPVGLVLWIVVLLSEPITGGSHPVCL